MRYNCSCMSPNYRKRETMHLSDFAVGDRVELHPATDLWMRGARFGEVVAIGRRTLRVRLDRIVGIVGVEPRDVTKVDPDYAARAARIDERWSRGGC